MSLAGVRSNRGDGYQTAIALNWAITMLHDPSIAWIEVDATSLDPAGQPIVVDDVVIAYRNGSRVYCQCKKNQVDFSEWDLAGLRDELVKAGEQLSRDPSGSVRFYSRNNFGDAAKLHEHAQTQPNSTAFIQSLTRKLQTTYATLDQYWSSALIQSKADVFSFLHRISFQTTPSVNELREQQLGLLRLHVTLAERAYDALLGRLDAVARRQSPTDTARAVATAGRLTREDVLRLFGDIGAEVTGPRTEVELTQTFRATSAIGRSWRRDIGRKRIPRAMFGELLALIDAKPKTILITDGPGFGKTCLLLDLIDALEISPTVATLFIQAREFSDCVIDAERVARGLPSDLIGAIARMAEYRQTIIIIDSLDVLSLAREHAVLGYFLGFIDRAEHIPGVTIVAACRSFDLKYDNRLSQRTWSNIISLGALDWSADVVPLLSEWDVIPESIPVPLANLLTNPRLLTIFEEIVRRGSVPSASTEQELTQRYLEAVVLRDSRLGQVAMGHIERLSRQMLTQRRLDMPRSRANLPNEISTVLLSEGVLVETERDTLAFGHQTLLDVLAISSAERSGDTLLTFIRGHLATPFVRPSIRAFFFYLRLHDPDGFVKQVRATLDTDEVAFHIKRLICESLAEIEPKAGDWRLVHHLFRNISVLFEAFYRGTHSPEWLAFMEAHWLPVIIAEKNGMWIEQHAQHISRIKELKPVKTIGFWLASLDLEWVNRERLVSTISLGLHDLKAWDTPGVGSVLERLVAAPRQMHDFLGYSLGRWVEATNSGDELLWRYISGGVTLDVVAKYHFDGKLCCGPSQFRDQELLARRMRQSEVLLNLAFNTLETWSTQRGLGRIGVREWRDEFLDGTSYGRIHSRHEHHHVDAEHVLLGAVEAACLAHAAANSSWWRNNESRLRASAEGAMRYISLLAFSKHPEANIDGIKSVLLDKHMLESSFRFEISNLINASFVLLDEATQDQIQHAILTLHDEDDRAESDIKPWVIVARRDLIAAIPAFLRSPEAQECLAEARRRFPDNERQAHIGSWSGAVAAPFSYERILELSDQAFVRLLIHYEYSDRDEWAREALVGGGDQVPLQLREASSRDPERYLRVLWQHWNEIPDLFREALLEGPATHLRYRFGNLTSQGQWTPITKPDGVTLAATILTELERHPTFWQGRREAAQSLEACAHVIDGQADSERLAFLLVGFVNAIDPKLDGTTGNDLITTAINSTRGMAAEAGLILANRLVEAGAPLPELLGPTLVRFACDPHPAIPAVLLRRLPVLQYHQPELGWRVFDAALRDKDGRMWEIAESCLYYAYYKCFKLVSPYLDRIEQTVSEGGGAVWGRISALAFLAGHLSFETLLDKLRSLKNSDAWSGAASVFAANASGSEHRECCLSGLAYALEQSPNPHAVAEEMVALFRTDSSISGVPITLLQGYFEGLAAGPKDGRLSLHDFQNWLSKRADSAPDEALGAAEIMLRTVAEHDLDLWDHEPYTALLTRLFREAEDREESDDGGFLTRVIALQDSLLRRGVYQLNEWLKDAERP